VTVEDIRQSIGKTMNWKAPGIDGLHNFWWKKITSSHSHLAKHFKHMIEHPETTPDFFTMGITFLLYKSRAQCTAELSSYHMPAYSLQIIYIYSYKQD